MKHSGGITAHTAVTLVFLTAICSPLATLRAESAYTEKYRPQFHFSPLANWIGDPDGLVRKDGNYHLFWWGHAVSADLVHWKEYPVPMKGDDGSFAYFSGSVVLDGDNTGGFKTGAESPMIAVYTAHPRAGGPENQRLSSSNDGVSFQYYPGNPVLDVDSRDPDVFWDTQTRRWIMLVVKPEAHKILFHASTDLKSWDYLSEFGPVGARDQNWEVPNLFQLPLDGSASHRKWVLVCGMGPNREQYFVGTFDGTRFTMDDDTRSYLLNGTGLPGETWADFEAVDYAGWTAQGDAFGGGPVSAALPVSGYLGRRIAASNAGGGDAAVGKLTSPPFTITRECINFLIGGGNLPGLTCINLLVDGQVVQTATGGNSDLMKWAGWNVAPWKGRPACIEIVDSSTARWGHVEIDHIQFSDVLMNTRAEHANWVDFGADFYAARAYRDYDNGGRSDCWLGWMSNWEYARDVPTSWGKGAESIPRLLALESSPRGCRLVQKPWPGLQGLRTHAAAVESRRIGKTAKLENFQPGRNSYEIEATFDLEGAAGKDFGLNLCVGGSDKVALGYEPLTGNVYLDRRASGNVSFHPRFPRVNSAPLMTKASRLTFHVFVDQSSVEVFVNDGEAVLTSLIFPDPASTGIELFSHGGDTTLTSLRAWELASIWN